MNHFKINLLFIFLPNWLKIIYSPSIWISSGSSGSSKGIDAVIASIGFGGNYIGSGYTPPGPDGTPPGAIGIPPGIPGDPGGGGISSGGG